MRFKKYSLLISFAATLLASPTSATSIVKADDTAPATAQTITSEKMLEGTWTGLWIFAGNERPMKIRFTKNDSEWTAEFNMSAADADTAAKKTYRAVDDLSVDLPNIRFAIPAQPTRMDFSGTFEEGIIVGDLSFKAFSITGVLELTEKIVE